MKFEIVFGVESHVFSFGRPFLENRCPSPPKTRRAQRSSRRFGWIYTSLSNVYIVPFCPPILSKTTDTKRPRERKQSLLSPFVMDNFTCPTDEYRAFSRPLRRFRILRAKKKTILLSPKQRLAKQWHGYIRVARGRRVNREARVFHGYREERRNPSLTSIAYRKQWRRV